MDRVGQCVQEAKALTTKGTNMAEVELEDHKVTEAEREFWRSLSVVLDHLAKRAVNAEAEVLKLRRELNVMRERIEFHSIMTGPDGPAAPNASPPHAPLGQYTIQGTDGCAS